MNTTLTKKERSCFKVVIKELFYLYSNMWEQETILGREYKLLKYLLDNPKGCTSKHISCLLKVTPTTVTDILCNLEEKKMLYRMKKSDDKRVKHIYITPNGRKAIRLLEKKKEEVYINSSVNLSKDDRDYLFSFTLCIKKRIFSRGLGDFLNKLSQRDKQRLLLIGEILKN